MATLPSRVERVRQLISNHTAERQELGVSACKLLRVEPEIAAMWRAIERRSEDRDPWVYIFLEFVKSAAELPPYHHLAVSKRRELAARISGISRELSGLLKHNQLDCQLIYSSGLNFHGFFFYEDFTDSNRATIDADEVQKLPVSRLLKGVAARAVDTITSVPGRGKAGRNVRAIRFIREFAAQVRRYYRAPLLSVVKTAANSIFGTHYTQGDIHNLLSR